MKTYTQTTTTQEPRLIIRYDSWPTNPRQWDNLGYFITCERNYQCPDKHEQLQNIVRTTGEQANNVAEHMKFIKKEIEQDGSKVVAIYPINRYEHGNVVYSIGSKTGFDYSNCGFYIITSESQNLLGTPKKSFEKVIAQELKEYNAYANGEVYEFVLYDENGEQIDQCSTFYSLDEIKDHLPKEWENENMKDYFNPKY